MLPKALWNLQKLGRLRQPRKSCTQVFFTMQIFTQDIATLRVISSGSSPNGSVASVPPFCPFALKYRLLIRQNSPSHPAFRAALILFCESCAGALSSQHGPRPRAHRPAPPDPQLERYLHPHEQQPSHDRRRKLHAEQSQSEPGVGVSEHGQRIECESGGRVVYPGRRLQL